jgi:hypothetical protein
MDAICFQTNERTSSAPQPTHRLKRKPASKSHRETRVERSAHPGDRGERGESAMDSRGNSLQTFCRGRCKRFATARPPHIRQNGLTTPAKAPNFGVLALFNPTSAKDLNQGPNRPTKSPANRANPITDHNRDETNRISGRSVREPIKTGYFGRLRSYLRSQYAVHTRLRARRDPAYAIVNARTRQSMIVGSWRARDQVILRPLESRTWRSSTGLRSRCRSDRVLALQVLTYRKAPRRHLVGSMRGHPRGRSV